jgi:hypothetical protein
MVYEFFAASQRGLAAILRLGNIEIGNGNQDGDRKKPRDHRDDTKADSPLHLPPPEAEDRTIVTTKSRAGRVINVRFGSKADICIATGHVRFTPNSDRESRLPQTIMSALPSKADMCGARAHVG